MKKLMYLLLISLTVSSVAQADNWFSRLFRRGDQSDAEQAADALAAGGEYRAPEHSLLEEADLREIAKKKALNSALTNEEEAERSGRHSSQQRYYDEQETAKKFFKRIPHKVSEGLLYGIQDAAREMGGSIGNKTVEHAKKMYSTFTMAPEEAAMLAQEKEWAKEINKLERQIIHNEIQKILITKTLEAEASEKELAIKKKQIEERRKKKIEAEEKEKALKAAIAEQQGPMAAQ